MYIGHFIDFLFFLDILANFNSAYYTELNEIEDDRKIIAFSYIKSWFFIDILAVLPFELIANLTASDNNENMLEDDGPDNYNQFVRITRVSKLYKLVKITRIIRLIKIAK